MLQATRLTKSQIKEVYAHLAQEPLENYEWLWVLESCLETAASLVYGLGTSPWPGGLLILHRGCAWVRLHNERLLEDLLKPLPKQDLYRFYTVDHNTLEMLQRWFPQGKLTESKLCVRNLTKTWRKRFEVSLDISPDPTTSGGEIYQLSDLEGWELGFATTQDVVNPWREIMNWYFLMNQDIAHWQEQIFGAMTANILSQDKPVVIRVVEPGLYDVLENLGYREFSKLYYYVAPGE